MNATCSFSYLMQVQGLPLVSPLKKEKLTRSLISTSNVLLSNMSNSVEVSSLPSTHSGPRLMRSATDAASAAIDFSKGNVDDGANDSPPSRGPGRTPICSPSPLKRVSSTRGSPWSPDRRAEGATHRKLDLHDDKAGGDPRLEDNDGPLPTLRSQRRIAVVDSLSGHQLPRPEDSRIRRRVLSGRSWRSYDTRSSGSRHKYATSGNVLPSSPAPSRSMSISNKEVPRSARKTKRKNSDSLSLEVRGAVTYGTSPQWPSRREDILRAVAKQKELESEKAAKAARATITAKMDTS